MSPPPRPAEEAIDRWLWNFLSKEFKNQTQATAWRFVKGGGSRITLQLQDGGQG